MPKTKDSRKIAIDQHNARAKTESDRNLPILPEDANWEQINEAQHIADLEAFRAGEKLDKDLDIKKIQELWFEHQDNSPKEDVTFWPKRL